MTRRTALALLAVCCLGLAALATATPAAACCSASDLTDTEFLLIDSSGTQQTYTVSDSNYIFCAAAGSQPSATDGYCYVNHDSDDDEWEFLYRDATCNFICLNDNGSCSSGIFQEFLTNSTSSTVTSELTKSDSSYAYCTTGGTSPNGTNHACWVNHDGDDDEFELFYRNAACNFFCIPDADVCTGVTFAEFLLVNSSGTQQTYTLSDSSYSYCAANTVSTSSSSGYCYANHDNDDDEWELLYKDATCNFLCIPS